MSASWGTALTVALISGTVAAWAQSTTGTIVGTVKDPNGAVVSGAVLKLLNTGTNASRTMLANGTGAFQFPNLDVGTYQLDVTAIGFEEVWFAPFDLGARETNASTSI